MSTLLAHPYALVAVSIFCGFLADFVLLGSVPFVSILPAIFQIDVV